MGIAGARLLGARVASFVGLTEVLFAVAFAWLLLGQHLDVVQGLGGLLVVGGISLVRLDELRATTPTILRSRAKRGERTSRRASWSGSTQRRYDAGSADVGGVTGSSSAPARASSSPTVVTPSTQEP